MVTIFGPAVRAVQKSAVPGAGGSRASEAVPSHARDSRPRAARSVKAESPATTRTIAHGCAVQASRSSAEIDDHDAPLGSVLVLVPPSPVVLLPPIVFLALAPQLDSVVVRRNVQLRAVLPAPLLFFPASDLFDDPGLEHGTPSLTSCNIPAP